MPQASMSAASRTAPRVRLGSRRRPAESRAAILQAAIAEFARNGMAGARTDAIARSAGVNKALLYYYFADKETLYGAALDHAFGDLRDRMMEVLDRDLPPRPKIFAYVSAYFDFIASHPDNRNLVQMEMMRAGHGSPHMRRIARKYFHPLFMRLTGVLRAGIDSGEFRPVDPMQFVPSMVSLVVFYFISAPVLKYATGLDPLTPLQIRRRRAAVLDFVSAALFRHNPASEGDAS
jgi:TetR/AcrR family transcriptional regulator